MRILESPGEKAALAGTLLASGSAAVSTIEGLDIVLKVVGIGVGLASMGFYVIKMYFMVKFKGNGKD